MTRLGLPSIPCHNHNHSCSSGVTYFTAADGFQCRGNGGLVQSSSHNHSQPSGICCLKSQSSSEELSLKHIGETAVESEHTDVERGPPNFERIMLRINGLKCGCCEGGISRAISRISAIKNPQVNVVLARVEFDLDTTRLGVTDVIKKLSIKTGYTFDEHVAAIATNSTHGVIATVDGSADRSWGENPKSTMVDGTIPRIHQQATRVHYDPNKIGARDVFEYYQKFDPDLRLAPPAAHPSLAVGGEQIRRALYVFLPALALTIPVIVLAWTPVDHNNLMYAHVSLALATVVQLIAIKEFIPNALRSLYYSRVFEMDFLIALSSTIAYIFSVVSYVLQVEGKPLETGSFFETSTLLVTLILLGRVINEFARCRAAKSVSFRSLQVDEALLVVPGSNTPTNPKTRRLDARLLQYDDQIKIPPHTKVVTDGVVLYGGSEIDESMITGESIPVAKGVHSVVFAGTNNGSGVLIVRLTALPHENSVHKIAAMVEDAELTKPRIQALADRIAGWFVPVIATIGASVFFIWLFVDKHHHQNTWKNAVVTAITYSIATLIVSCPCAIGLAVPMVVLIASGVAARFGIIFRDFQKLEIARSVTDVVFDKTGTLTCGFPAVVGEEYHGSNASLTKGIVLGLLKDVNHPVSASIFRHLERDMRMNPEKNIKVAEVQNVMSIPGEGVQGTYANNRFLIRAGSPDWLNVHVLRQASTIFCVQVGGILCATFKLLDRPRHTAEMVVQQLKARGIEVHMISGDNQGAVDDTAHSLSIPKKNTKSRCKPDGKMNYVRDLQRPGKVVMFVGDGTNDSVALKQADVGVHLNQGSDVAKSAADVVLMTTRLHDVLILLDVSRAAYRRIILNFSWSAFYNIFAILLAAGAFVKIGEQIRIEPQWAGLGELVSVMPVVLIALQMRWRNYGRRYRAIEYDYLRAEPPMREHRVQMRQQNSSSEDGEYCGLPSGKKQVVGLWKECGQK
ncbi:E1-E2 ATPase-domain-containing protein [Pyrenochaeta sp. MPI-SDFR-AT-0127]|nr:E1-E2 ATPase-domain-containing protein [Pyrenochaeta sp. MPI-SDFR-AT-0127]